MSIRLGLMIAALLGFSAVAMADETKPPAKKTAKHGKKGKQAKAEAPAPVEAPPAEAPKPEPEWYEAVPHVTGPKLVDFGNETELDVPAGFVLFERAQAQELMRKGGDDGENVVGVLIKPGSEWSVIIQYDGIGYVNDDDADELKADELMESYRQGTEQQNVRRKTLGVPELFIDGWSEQPRYERAKRHLVWGLNAHTNEGKVINYFTRILGRGGYLSLNLIDSPETIEKSKTEALVLLTATRFKAGARYEDYKEGDKSSGIGLKTLVLGGAGIVAVKAAKAGILVAILAKLKFIIVGIGAAIAGFFKWMFGRKKTDPTLAGMPPSGPPDGNV